ncbi:MAG: hypothetical protein JXJ22_07045 [Bacteroidales bacterium]|nr:hypothetical protein [Bacteroidales bacterium]
MARLYFFNFLFFCCVIHAYSIPDTYFSNAVPNDTVIIKADTIHLTDTVYIYIEEESKWQMSFELYMKPIFPIGKYGAVSPLNEELTSYYNKERTGMASVGLGVNFGIEYLNWNIRLGLTYSNYKEKVAHEPTNVVTENKTLVEIITFPPYPVVYHGDTTWYYPEQRREYQSEVTTYLNKPYTNSYLFFEIPFSIGYHFRFTKFSYLINTGFSPGFYIRRVTNKNIALFEEDNLQYIDEQNDMKIFNLSVFVSVDINYYHSEKLDFFIEPYFRQHLNSFFKSTYMYQYLPASVGINLGIKYYF